MKFRDSLHEFVPPILLNRRQPKSPPSQLLFDGQDSLFRELMTPCSVYGEYGVGLSTLTAFKDYRCEIISVDTSREWINEVVASGVDREDRRVRIIWIDLGLLTHWGRPASYEKSHAFSEYTQCIWRQDNVPDLVLVDGRFRVACFLESLLHGVPGTPIIFDDYVDRPHYHVVESIISPSQILGRQALFNVPKSLNKLTVRRMCEQFLMVMD